MDLVDLSDWGNKFAHELSGGMQQRVGLARALAVDSQVLLMDEPFSALDPLIRRQLQSEFMKLAKTMNKTTVFITHDLDEAVRIGHRIAIMRDGRMVQIGTAEDIVMNPADEYVEEFVSGISRFKLIRAHAIMVDVKRYEDEKGPLPKEIITFSESEKLEIILSTAADSDVPIGITNSSLEIVGIIDRAILLKEIIEGASENG